MVDLRRVMVRLSLIADMIGDGQIARIHPVDDPEDCMIEWEGIGRVEPVFSSSPIFRVGLKRLRRIGRLREVVCFIHKGNGEKNPELRYMTSGKFFALMKQEEEWHTIPWTTIIEEGTPVIDELREYLQ